MPAGFSALALRAEDCASVVRATTWGIADDRSRIALFFSGYGAPTPFDEDYRARPAVGAMLRFFTSPSP